MTGTGRLPSAGTEPARRTSVSASPGAAAAATNWVSTTCLVSMISARPSLVTDAAIAALLQKLDAPPRAP